jgi:hypothetical protein
MAEDTKSSFGGFDAVIGDLVRGNDNIGGIVDSNEIKRQMESLGETKDKDSENEPADTSKSKTPTIGGIKDERTTSGKSKQPSINVKDPGELKRELEGEEDEVEDVEDVPEDKKVVGKDQKKDVENTTKKDSEEKVDEIDVEEKELVEAFSDLFAEELEWKFENGEKPSNIKDLVKYMQGIIETNSEPSYANDEIKELDEYVRDGGTIKDYYSKVYRSEIDVDNIDLTKVDNQKAVIRENLRNRGYSEPRIDKLISRYEENDALEEESSDSQSEVKEYREKSKKQLLDNQKKQQEDDLKGQLMFVQNVEKIIKDIDNIRGISIPDKEKKVLMEYIFKPGRDGMTAYQKDYNSNLKNLVESAYFTMKGDTLINNIQKRAASDAVKNLKTKLKAKDNSIKNTGSDMDDGGGQISHLWDLASKELQSFK